MKKNSIIFLLATIVGLVVSLLTNFDIFTYTTMTRQKTSFFKLDKKQIISSLKNRNTTQIANSQLELTKFPPPIINDKVKVNLSSQERKVLRYWINKKPLATINWANSRQYTRLLMLQYIAPIWISKNTPEAISWYKNQHNKEELHFLLPIIGKFGEYNATLNFINELINNSMLFPSSFVESFLDARINKNYKQIKKWVFTSDRQQVYEAFAYIVSKHKGFIYAKEVLEEIQDKENNILDFSHPVYKKTFYTYFKKNTAEALINLIRYNSETKNKPEIFFPFIVENLPVIQTSLKRKKNQSIIKYKPIKDVLDLAQCVNKIIKNKEKISALEKKAKKIRDEKLVSTAFLILLKKKFSSLFSSNAKKSLQIMSLYKVNSPFLTHNFIKIHGENPIKLKRFIIDYPNLFYSKTNYTYLARTLAKKFSPKSLALSKNIDDKKIYTAYITNIIKFCEEKYDFTAFCQGIKDISIRSLAYVAFSNNLLRYDKQRAIRVFIKNYTKESQVVEFFTSLIKKDKVYAKKFLTNHSFSNLTNSTLLGILTYYDSSFEKLTSVHTPDITETAKKKIRLAYSLSKINNLTNFTKYINTLSTSNQNHILLDLDRLIKRK